MGRGAEFEVLDHRHNWGEDRVTLADAEGRVFSLPACWTTVSPVDPVVAIAEGRRLRAERERKEAEAKKKESVL